MAAPIVIQPGGWPCCCPATILGATCFATICSCTVPGGTFTARLLRVQFAGGPDCAIPFDWSPNLCHRTNCVAQGPEDIANSVEAGGGAVHTVGGQDFNVSYGISIRAIAGSDPCQIAIYVGGQLGVCFGVTIFSPSGPTITLNPGDCDINAFVGTYELDMTSIPSPGVGTGTLTIQVSRAPC